MHDRSGTSLPTGLLVAVEAAFARLACDLSPWPDPHPEREFPDELYSRVTDPERYRVIGARADAWAVALADGDLATVERDATIRWRTPPGPVVTRTDRVVPHAAGALTLVLGRSRLGDVDDAGLVIGVGDPADAVTILPTCGCDACDSGSDDLLNELDATIVAVVTGRYRHLRQGDRRITVLGDSSQGSGTFRPFEWDAVLQDPTGWDETTGPPWTPHDL